MSASVFSECKIHPVAEFFPMMSDEELDDLAQDIKANGLVEPIVLDKDRVLIDGRNRLEACRRAEIKPQFVTLANGTDPISFIFSENDKRRHLTKGQRAMIGAKIRALSQTTTRQAAQSSGVDLGQIGKASVVIQYREDLVEEVMKGKPLNEAYAEALKEKAAKESDESKRERLRRDAPDLADQVLESTLTLIEAIAALNAREREEEQRKEALRQQRQLSTRFLCDTVTYCDPYACSVEGKADRFLELFDAKFSTEELTAERLSKCGEVLICLASKWKT
jgi:hypothetical protein